MYEAIKSGNIELVRTFVLNDENIDKQDVDGQSLIMLASKNNQKEIVAYLLRFNPNLYLLNKDGETVFQIAERLEDDDIFKKLLNHCWIKEEKLYLFEYQTTPNFNSDFKGAYANCWIMNEEFNVAKALSRKIIEDENWEIVSLEDITEIKQHEIDKEDERYQYYEQVIIDKVVLVFYLYEEEE